MTSVVAVRALGGGGGGDGHGAARGVRQQRGDAGAGQGRALPTLGLHVSLSVGYVGWFRWTRAAQVELRGGRVQANLTLHFDSCVGVTLHGALCPQPNLCNARGAAGPWRGGTRPRSWWAATRTR